MFASSTAAGPFSILQPRDLLRRRCVAVPLRHLIKRALFVSLHACWQVADFLAADPIDSDQHEGVFLQSHDDGTVMGAFLWRTVRGQGCGGIRLRSYEGVEAYIRDGLRLATGMIVTNGFLSAKHV